MPTSEESLEYKSTKSEGGNARVTVKISLKPKFGKEELKSKYKVDRYTLSEGYAMSPTLQALVPKGTPEFVEHGENYVERIMRALYHFKQCALIGPSGTGKSVRGSETIDVMLNGRQERMTFDELFAALEGDGNAVVSNDGWETMLIRNAEVLVLSFDRATGQIRWRVPFAFSRTAHDGDMAVVSTASGRALAATPDHSFLTLAGTIKAGDL